MQETLSQITDLLIGVERDVLVTAIVGIVSVAALLTCICRRRRRISNPTDLQTSDVTYESVTLEWEKPEKNSRLVTSYTVFCRSDSDPKDAWESKATCTKEEVVVKGLEPRTTYYFKVRPEHNNKPHKESDVTGPVTTEPKYPGKPVTKPQSTELKQSSIALKWGKPEYGEDLVVKHIVYYRLAKKSPGQWKDVVVESNSCSAVIGKLKPDTKYEFKVVPVGEHGSECESDVSDSIKTNRVLALRMKDQSKRIGKPQDFPVKYVLPMKAAGESRYIIGDPTSYSPTDQKVLMLMGATGAGKTTLINGIVNYYLNIKLDEGFRFELEHKVVKTQAHSQTSSVTAYTFYPMDGSRVPYVLTIIDTPGFADTRGIREDRETLRKINDFLSIGAKYGIDHFNGVGVVVQAALPRLTSTQLYIFDSVLSVLASDVESNMFLMITFADNQTPSTLSSIQEAKMPYCNFFKFNNSALFANPKDPITRGFWELGMDSFDEFFDEFGKIKSVSIKGSHKVLMDRQQLQTIIEELQKKIAFGLESINILKLEKGRLEDYGNDMRTSENFTYEITSTKHQRKNLPADQKALNCKNCFSTCHYPCELEPDEEIRSCAIMKSGFCTICPSKCSWERHELQGFMYEYVREKKKMENKRLKSQFDDAKAKHENTTKVVADLESDLSKARMAVMIMIEQARECQQRLNEMALRPGALTTADYVNVLIQSEKSEKKDGYLQRIEALEGMKRASELHTKLSTDKGNMDLLNKFW